MLIYAFRLSRGLVYEGLITAWLKWLQSWRSFTKIREMNLRQWITLMWTSPSSKSRYSLHSVSTYSSFFHPPALLRTTLSWSPRLFRTRWWYLSGLHSPRLWKTYSRGELIHWSFKEIFPENYLPISYFPKDYVSYFSKELFANIIFFHSSPTYMVIFYFYYVWLNSV